MKWLPKLMGFDYEVEYKKGSDNAAADALSRREDASELFTMATTSITTDLYQSIEASLTQDEHLHTILVNLQKGEIKKHYAIHNGQLLRKGKLVVGNNKSLRKDLLAHFHEEAIGLLQPLPIPKTVWASISMDFIEGLPKSHGNTSSSSLFDQVCKLHGMPESIVSDRDKVFLSTFWKELFKLLHVKLLLSTSYHPQTDGQTECWIGIKCSLEHTFWKEIVQASSCLKRCCVPSTYHPRNETGWSKELRWLEETCESCEEKKINDERLRIEEFSTEELAEFINSPSWSRPAFYLDDDEEYTIAITNDLPTEEPDNSLSMRDEHLDTIPTTESDEVIKSSVENLVLIPRESEVTSDNESECDVPVDDESSPTFATFSNPLFDSDNDFSSSDDESFSEFGIR
ncbi:retrotransposon-related protein [Tanacetum coccineum]|uniref:Retrotransposon-related protein n=1 Tax=Tanacetum coccineum TaxID=301880 RepID=A0ABQ4ZT08_9ASTR